MRLSCLFALLAGLPHAAPDGRFGFAGTGGRAFAEKFGVPYHALEGNYHASTGPVFSSVNPANDPPPGLKVLRKVAKLNVRIDGLGETNATFRARLDSHAIDLASWHIQRIGPKPQFAWYAPDAAALASAESLQIVETVRREKIRNPAITGTVWEIGNEPNLFPAILPAEYAGIFSRYHRILKEEDSSALVAMGPFFVREAAEDLRPRMREVLEGALIDRGLGQPGQPLFDSVHADLWDGLSARVMSVGTAEYVAQCFASMDSAAHPDVVSLHVYPFDDREPAREEGELARVLDSLLDALGALAAERGAAAPFWITEFGNIDMELSEEGAASLASDLIDVFAGDPRIRNWFYYKATGADEQFSLLPGVSPPLTRLAVDSAFDPPDGNFPCDRLNAIGRMYYGRTVGEPCGDGGVPVARGAFAGTFGFGIDGAGTVLLLTVPAAAGVVPVRVRVFDLSGRGGDVVFHRDLPPGRHRIPLRGNAAEFGALSAGVYGVEVRARDFRGTLRFARIHP